MQKVEEFPVLFTDWQMQNKDKETVEIILLVLEKKIIDTEDEEKEKRRFHGYFTNLPKDRYKDEVDIVVQLYRKRWGIETAHRLQDKFRIKTTSVNGIVRYFFFVIGVLLYNMWVFVNLLVCENVKEYRICITVYKMNTKLRGILLAVT